MHDVCYSLPQCGQLFEPAHPCDLNRHIRNTLRRNHQRGRPREWRVASTSAGQGYKTCQRRLPRYSAPTDSQRSISAAIGQWKEPDLNALGSMPDGNNMKSYVGPRSNALRTSGSDIRHRPNPSVDAISNDSSTTMLGAERPQSPSLKAGPDLLRVLGRGSERPDGAKIAVHFSERPALPLKATTISADATTSSSDQTRALLRKALGWSPNTSGADYPPNLRRQFAHGSQDSTMLSLPERDVLLIFRRGKAWRLQEDSGCQIGLVDEGDVEEGYQPIKLTGGPTSITLAQTLIQQAMERLAVHSLIERGRQRGGHQTPSPLKHDEDDTQHQEQLEKLKAKSNNQSLYTHALGLPENDIESVIAQAARKLRVDYAAMRAARWRTHQEQWMANERRWSKAQAFALRDGLPLATGPTSAIEKDRDELRRHLEDAFEADWQDCYSAWPRYVHKAQERMMARHIAQSRQYD